jgi:hypothetical protein
MGSNLFSKPTEYTIDASSLIAMFGNESILSKNYTPGLWERVLGLINEGIIISHIEVLYELKKDGIKGEELYEWAHANENIFKDYQWKSEGKIIRVMSPKYGAFVNGKVSNVHADPWLIAQAKTRKLKIISEEAMSHSSDVKKHRIPNVCADSAFGVDCVDLWKLMKERNWQLK